MKPFDENAVCPKCGHTDIAVFYYRGQSETSICPVLHRHEEHLHRSCRRCHYSWAEACLDAYNLAELKADPQD
jgi:predicted nucleic-acid-binding Zn-ribbon protein